MTTGLHGDGMAASCMSTIDDTHVRAMAKACSLDGLQEGRGGPRGCAAARMSLRRRAAGTNSARPDGPGRGRKNGQGVAGGASRRSALKAHSGQCSCRCLLSESPDGATGSPATSCRPVEVQISVNDGAPAGRALASRGQSALSAMTAIASQQTRREEKFLGYIPAKV